MGRDKEKAMGVRILDIGGKGNKELLINLILRRKEWDGEKTFPSSSNISPEAQDKLQDLQRQSKSENVEPLVQNIRNFKTGIVELEVCSAVSPMDSTDHRQVKLVKPCP